MAKYDQSLKSLISRAHDGFLPLISPDYVWREELSPELPAHARQADILWLAYNTRTEREFLLHIELQLRVEDDLGIRMAEYGIRAHRRTPIPLRSVVIFLKPSNTIPTTPYIIPSDNEEYWMLCNYKQIKLWEIPQSAVLATSSYDLWPLAALMQDVTRESIIATAQQIATAPAARAERTLLNDTLINFSGIRLPSTVVRKNGGGNRDDARYLGRIEHERCPARDRRGTSRTHGQADGRGYGQGDGGEHGGEHGGEYDQSEGSDVYQNGTRESLWAAQRGSERGDRCGERGDVARPC